MDTNEKYFLWYDSSNHIPTFGPYYYSDSQLIGQKFYHPLSEILKTSVSETLQKKLISAKPGTCIKMHRLHSNGDMMVKCIEKSELKSIEEYSRYVDKISVLSAELKDLKSTTQKLASKLTSNKNSR